MAASVVGLVTASAVGQTTVCAVDLVAACAVGLVAACAAGGTVASTVTWAGDAVSAAELSTVVGPAAGLPMTAVKLKAA